MNLTFSPEAWDDYLYWYRTDQKVLDRIHALIQAILRDPFRGIGKPEPLKQALSVCWSRRIDAKHRIVYRVKAGAIELVQLRWHY